MATKLACNITHPQLRRGRCPWCDAYVVEGELATTPNSADQGQERIWNTEVLERDLRDPACGIRMETVTNLLLHSPPVDDAIPLLAIALDDSDVDVREHAGHALSSVGRVLSHERASQLESHVGTSQHELALRSLLVGYYFLGRRQSKAAELARRNHILWLIEHAPDINVCGQPDCSLRTSEEDADGYQQAKAFWLAHIESNPNDVAILTNAASFFSRNDPVLSEKLLLQGQTLEPENPYWHERLGQLYALRSRRNRHRDSTASAKSFAAYEKAEQVREDRQAQSNHDVSPVQSILSRIHSLSNLARSALDAFEFEKAANYATELLSLARSNELPEYFRNDGNAIHNGNLVLGCVALEMGDIEQAKLRLLASGKTKGAPNLKSFGPNMSLAKTLLERGERDVVCQYLELCKKFWNRGIDQLDKWTQDIRDGKIPDFGANLVY